MCKSHCLESHSDNEIDMGYRYFPQENTQALVDRLFAQDQQKRLTSIRFAEWYFTHFWATLHGIATSYSFTDNITVEYVSIKVHSSLALATTLREVGVPWTITSLALFQKHFGNNPLPNPCTLPLFPKQQSLVNLVKELYIPRPFLAPVVDYL